MFASSTALDASTSAVHFGHRIAQKFVATAHARYWHKAAVFGDAWYGLSHMGGLYDRRCRVQL